MTNTAVLQKLATNPEEVSVWSVRPFQLVSLLDMKKYAVSFIQDLSNIGHSLIHDLDKRESVPGDEILSDDHCKKADKLLGFYQDHVTYLGLTDLLSPILEIRLVNFYKPYRWADYAADVRYLQKRVDEELSKVTFGFIPADRVPYYGNENLLNPKARERFPLAAREVFEAGICYANGCDTACVFHLMRAAEYGLRALAKKLRISFKTKKGASVPIDLQEWGTIIEKIESTIDAMKSLPKGRRKSDDLKFYSEVAKEFRYLKDAWRNHVMHTRTFYDEHQAMGVMAHMARVSKPSFGQAEGIDKSLLPIFSLPSLSWQASWQVHLITN